MLISTYETGPRWVFAVIVQSIASLWGSGIDIPVVVVAITAALTKLIAVIVGSFALVILLVMLMRGLQALLELATTWERAVYLSYLIVGAVFTIAGVVLFKMRNTAAS